MPLFYCRLCRTVDNTALAHAWDSWIGPKAKGEVPLCTECKTGTWHGEFPKQSVDDGYVGPSGKRYHYVPDECNGTMPGRVDAVEVSEETAWTPEQVKADTKRKRKAGKVTRG